MADRLSALDASFLHLESATTPMHVGGVAVFARSRRRLDFETLAAHIESRISLVPRYRQRIASVPGNLANPVWIDDVHFDISYHLRRSVLPRPGSEEQLFDLVARLMSRQLDRSRPLWEMYVVEGLAGGRTAVITKTHHAMVDGIGAVDIGQVILDPTPKPRDVPTEEWTAAREPSPIELVVDAVTEIAQRPSAAVDAARMAMLDVRTTVEKVAGVAGGVLAAARTAGRPAPETVLNVDIGRQRRFAVTRTRLDDYRAVRKQHGGTVNDVVLATVAGALRRFFFSRGEPIGEDTVVRAMVPVSIRRDGDTSPGNWILLYFVDLPVGEPDPVLRLKHISDEMQAHKQAGQSMGAASIIRMSGFAPPTLHALGARAAGSFSRRIFNVLVTNVPGPQLPLYAAGARMQEVFPVVPLAKGQALSVGLTSYNGGVYYGLNADRDALSDVDVLPAMLDEALAELVATI